MGSGSVGNRVGKSVGRPGRNWLGSLVGARIGSEVERVELAMVELESTPVESCVLPTVTVA